ncbi:unnamed protein product [Musa hybrid cultivar]
MKPNAQAKPSQDLNQIHWNQIMSLLCERIGADETLIDRKEVTLVKAQIGEPLTLKPEPENRITSVRVTNGVRNSGGGREEDALATSCSDRWRRNATDGQRSEGAANDEESPGEAVRDGGNWEK